MENRERQIESKVPQKWPGGFSLRSKTVEESSVSDAAWGVVDAFLGSVGLDCTQVSIRCSRTFGESGYWFKVVHENRVAKGAALSADRAIIAAVEKFVELFSINHSGVLKPPTSPRSVLIRGPFQIGSRLTTAGMTVDADDRRSDEFTDSSSFSLTLPIQEDRLTWAKALLAATPLQGKVFIIAGPRYKSRGQWVYAYGTLADGGVVRAKAPGTTYDCVDAIEKMLIEVIQLYGVKERIEEKGVKHSVDS